MTGKQRAIVWFRQDLRIADNPALHAAAGSGLSILPIYVLDEHDAGDWRMGGASRWWLHQSLWSLDAALNGHLSCFRGSSEDVLLRVVEESGAKSLFLNQCVEPWRRNCDSKVFSMLEKNGVEIHVHRAATLFDLENVRKPNGEPYRVFTPFYRKGCLEASEAPREPIAAPASFETEKAPSSHSIDSLGLMPNVAWYEEMADAWQCGEDGAQARLEQFLDGGLKGYQSGRNRPDLDHVSRLSPHLHFGEISPHQIWHAVSPRRADATREKDVDCFLSELGWREFSHYLLWHFPDLPTRNLQSKFDRFPWLSDDAALECWQRGETGYPIVDAGMRELWRTGYMHNRVRMIVGSFLVKNLLQHWRSGEAWFWDTLVDADLANNSASWQWVAGSGADAAPYFRIFNPVTQGKKFDPKGDYVRRYLPEIAALPDSDIHAPWEAPAVVRQGLNYPDPIVELKPSRERALTAFRELSTG